MRFSNLNKFSGQKYFFSAFEEEMKKLGKSQVKSRKRSDVFKNLKVFMFQCNAFKDVRDERLSAELVHCKFGNSNYLIVTDKTPSDVYLQSAASIK